MGLEAVIDEIRQKGEIERDQIRQETQKECDQILATAQEQAERIKLEAEEELEKDSERILSQETSAANLVVKRELLNTQKALLDRVYIETLEAIAELPESFHREAVKHILTESAQEIPEGIVHANERDMQTLKEVISQDPAFKGYQPGKIVDVKGGIIIESLDGEIQIDHSYRTYLDVVWESGLKDASDILFG